jgi:transposase-like protein
MVEQTAVAADRALRTRQFQAGILVASDTHMKAQCLLSSLFWQEGWDRKVTAAPVQCLQFLQVRLCAKRLVCC